LIGAHPRLKDYPEIREYFEEELIALFESTQDELRAQASENIAKIQEENKQTFNKKRQKAKIYHKKNLIAIRRTQQDQGLNTSSL